MNNYQSKEELLHQANQLLSKSLHEYLSKIVSEDALHAIEVKAEGEHKGYIGDLVEEYVFALPNNNRPEADFADLGVELKTTPLKENKDGSIVAKERISFSMINYVNIVDESWEESTFLKKNATLLILFYLWVKAVKILDYEFKFAHIIELLQSIPDEEILQIQHDWQFIVNKIRNGEAHLLSEGDTNYLGACTKGSAKSKDREQPFSDIAAKPRAFSLKNSYLTYIFKTHVLEIADERDSLLEDQESPITIDEIIEIKIGPFINATVEEIESRICWSGSGQMKARLRNIVNRILGVTSNKIKELENANVTLRVINLEADGSLNEHISFPAFEYKDLVAEHWYDERTGESTSDLFSQLDSERFLFVIFQKQENNSVFLKGYKFWSFPQDRMLQAKSVWEETIRVIESGTIVHDVTVSSDGRRTRHTNFPGSTFNHVIHVRPHATTTDVVSELPVPDNFTGESEYTKYSFWLDKDFIRESLQSD